MKILLINTFETAGGAAIACKRLLKALQESGVDAKLLVRDKNSNDPSVYSVNNSLCQQWINKFRFYWERMVIFILNRFSKKNLFKVSIANTGIDIHRHPLVKEADIIHLHWTNQGMLSLKDLEKLARIGKPIVWTMHDQWAYTSICHYTSDCKKYITNCTECPQLEFPKEKDISYRVFLKKKSIYKKSKITFVGCSKWIADLAKASSLCGKSNIQSVPNPIDISIYYPRTQQTIRKQLGFSSQEKLILFGACKVIDKRKGIDYLKAACDFLYQQNKFTTDKFVIGVFGANSEDLSAILPYKVFNFGYIDNVKAMANLYSAVDLFLIPSLEDNLPNTIMEAMACGTPCVGFDTGGIPEMIDHKLNGYVAKYKDVEDLANGILWSLEHADELSKKAREKIINCYSESIIARQYIKLYQELLYESNNKI